MRRAISKAVELAQKGVRKLVLELPTGYGKTSAGPYLYHAYRELGLCWKAIHVFPLRTTLHKTLQKYVGEFRGIDFAYQDGDVTFASNGYVKDPFFTHEYVLTTLDSFIHNLLRAPIVELHKFYKESMAIHYHEPFSYIYPSCVIFDEAHLAAQDESGKSGASLKVALNVLSEADIPVVVMSATLGDWKWSFFEDFTFVRLGASDSEDGRSFVVRDEEFERSLEKVRYVFHGIEYDKVAEVARSQAEKGRRVLIVLNDIARVIELSRDLGAPVVHSLLTREDRRRAEEMINDAWIFVGTSAIEAGVDVSFDTLITTVDSIESLVQRLGRVCRKGWECEGEVYLVGGDGDLEKYNRMEWRLPYRENSYAGLLRRDVNPDESLSYVLNMMMGFLHLRKDEIKRIFRRYGGSFVRIPLIEVCVGSVCTYEKSFTISLDRAEALRNLDVKVKVGDNLLEPPSRFDFEWLSEILGKHNVYPTLVLREENYERGYGPCLRVA